MGVLFALGSLSFTMIGLFVPETLRSLVGNGSRYVNPIPWQWFLKHLSHQPMTNLKTQNHFQFKQFLKLFQYILKYDVILILIFNGLHFTSYYSVMVTTTKLLDLYFQLATMLIGLCFLSQGGDTILGSFLHGKLLYR